MRGRLVQPDLSLTRSAERPFALGADATRRRLFFASKHELFRSLRTAGLTALLLTAWLLFASFPRGLSCSNDGSTLALIKALAHDHSFAIDNYFRLTGKIDYSACNTHYYSDRPPGTAFAAWPFYLLGLQWGRLFRGVDWPTSALFGALLAPLLAALATVWLVARIGLSFGAAKQAALAAAAVFLLGSPAWIYSGTLFVHSIAAFCVTAAVALAILLEQRLRADRAESAPQSRSMRRLALLCGLTAGWSMITDYSTLLLIPVYAVFLTWVAWRPRRRRLLLSWWLVGLAGPALLLAIYNSLCFGGPFTTSYAYSVSFPWAHSLGTTYVTPLWEGLRGLLFIPAEKVPRGYPTGQLFWSPVLLLATIGYIIALMNRRTRRPAALACAVMLIVIAVSAKHRTWWGGGTGDARYIYAITPLWFAGLAPWLQLLTRPRARFLRWSLWSLTVLLIAATLLLRYIWATAVVGAHLAVLPGDQAYLALHGKPHYLWQSMVILFTKWPTTKWLFPTLFLIFTVIGKTLGCDRIRRRNREESV